MSWRRPPKRYFKVKVRDAGTLEADLPTADTMVDPSRLVGLARADAVDAENCGWLLRGAAVPLAALIMVNHSLAVRSAASFCV
jgi:hypothetical protein